VGPGSSTKDSSKTVLRTDSALSSLTITRSSQDAGKKILFRVTDAFTKKKVK